MVPSGRKIKMPRTQGDAWERGIQLSVAAESLKAE